MPIYFLLYLLLAIGVTAFMRLHAPERYIWRVGMDVSEDGAFMVIAKIDKRTGLMTVTEAREVIR